MIVRVAVKHHQIIHAIDLSMNELKLCRKLLVEVLLTNLPQQAQRDATDL